MTAHYCRALVVSLFCSVFKREKEINMATTTTRMNTHQRRCEPDDMRHDVHHVCREGCYWIDEPIDHVMASRIVLLTPDIALNWLKRNSDNRSFSRDSARLLAAEMNHGYWRENGEAVIFDTNGILIDGQHRLQAVVNSGHEYRVPIITGIQSMARPTVDTGKKRSGAQNLQMAGEKNASVLAAVLTLWKGYVAHDLRAMTHPASAAPERRTTIPRIMEDLEEYPELKVAAQRSMALRPTGQGRALVSTSETALLWQAITWSGATIERAEEFLASVLSGYNLSEGNPIIALRRRLIDQMGPGLKMDKRERLALILKTWQIWSTGQTRKIIRWEPTEPFPFLS